MCDMGSFDEIHQETVYIIIALLVGCVILAVAASLVAIMKDEQKN